MRQNLLAVERVTYHHILISHFVRFFCDPFELLGGRNDAKEVENVKLGGDVAAVGAKGQLAKVSVVETGEPGSCDDCRCEIGVAVNHRRRIAFTDASVIAEGLLQLD